MQCSACGCACGAGAGGEVPWVELEAPLIDLEEGPCQCHTPPPAVAAAAATPETSWAGFTAAQEAAMDTAALRIIRCIGRVRDVMLADERDLLFLHLFFRRRIQSTLDLTISELPLVATGQYEETARLTLGLFARFSEKIHNQNGRSRNNSPLYSIGYSRFSRVAVHLGSDWEPGSV
ncbi:hypothetical protein ACP4OV_015055 [Aristida adscensionis]